jgi:hypothetical protein
MFYPWVCVVCAALAFASALAFAEAASAEGPTWALTTDDTAIALTAADSGPVVTRLTCGGSGHEWLAQPAAVPLMAGQTWPFDKAVFQVAFLDSGLRLLRNGVETLEEGTADRATVYPRGIVEAAMNRGASAMILAHNHLNGDVWPSEQDKTVTRAILLAASAVQIQVADHLVNLVDKVFGFAEEGLL